MQPVGLHGFVHPEGEAGEGLRAAAETFFPVGRVSLLAVRLNLAGQGGFSDLALNQLNEIVTCLVPQFSCLLLSITEGQYALPASTTLGSHKKTERCITVVSQR